MVHPSHFKHILDGLMTAVIVLDDERRLYSVNSSAEALLGVSSEHILGKPIGECIKPISNDGETILDLIYQDGSFTMRKARWEVHNHTVITVDYSVIPNPELDAIIIEVQPLDRLLRISREESLQATAETSRNLIRSVAHEIKNPLGGIRGAAQLLSRELDSNDLEEYTRVIISETDRLRNLVDRMLGPHRPAERDPINVHEVLEHVISVLRAETDNALSMKRDYDPSIPMIPADQELLIQAVLNIGRNAMQVLLENDMRDTGQITFCTRIKRRITIGRVQHPLVVKVCIVDNGPGIPADLIEDIFFPMITGRAEGTGLGLAIAQNLIGQHDGVIECDSRPGHTQFAIYLPLELNYAQT